MRTSEERRAFRQKAINHAKKLEKDLGFKGGTLYEKHIEKVKENPGYYDKGSLSHYIQTKPKIKSSGKNYKHGSKISTRLSKRDQNQNNDMDSQMNEFF